MLEKGQDVGNPLVSLKQAGYFSQSVDALCWGAYSRYMARIKNVIKSNNCGDTYPPLTKKLRAPKPWLY